MDEKKLKALAAELANFSDVPTTRALGVCCGLSRTLNARQVY